MKSNVNMLFFSKKIICITRIIYSPELIICDLGNVLIILSSTQILKKLNIFVNCEQDGQIGH